MAKTHDRKETRRLRRLDRVKRELHNATRDYVKAEHKLSRAYGRYVEAFSKDWG